jgi:hypothetical protein
MKALIGVLRFIIGASVVGNTLTMLEGIGRASRLGTTVTDFIANTGVIIYFGFRWLGYMVLLAVFWLALNKVQEYLRDYQWTQGIKPGHN